ncbi:MAG: heme o synthase [Maricaulaceae bacterium]
MTDLSVELSRAPVSNPAPAQARDFIALLKPRVMSLVVFTAFVGLIAAPGDVHPLEAVIAVVCIAVGAGAAGALNMAYDADIDAIMTRTRLRPVARGAVPATEAYTFGLVLSALSVLGLALVSYEAAAWLAVTIAFYAVIYTVWLKRATPQNIVIGGAAGAFPPVIGWAVAADGFAAEPWLLFLIIFLWTPPHFWALALYKAGDYDRAGVPMMPVVKGPAAPRRQCGLYALALAPAGFAPALIGLGGVLYAGVSGLAGLMFLGLAWRVVRSRAGERADAASEADLYAVASGDKAARDLFAFSILYLFALFAALLVEHALGLYAPVFGAAHAG